MERADADSLASQFLALRFDAGLHVLSAEVVGLPDRPLLLVRFEDDTRPGTGFGAWWDFHGYEDYLHEPAEMAWLAQHAKIHLEEIFWAGPELEARPRDDAGVGWCAMDTLDTRLPPERL